MKEFCIVEHLQNIKRQANRGLDATIKEVLELTGIAMNLEDSKNNAYKERDMLVCALSKLFPSHLQRHPDADKDWEDDWRWIVFIQLPTGQATWHIHDSDLEWFDHLSRDKHVDWDGHTTEEKYKRLAGLK
jgi:hypothetical protein